MELRLQPQKYHELVLPEKRIPGCLVDSAGMGHAASKCWHRCRHMVKRCSVPLRANGHE